MTTCNESVDTSRPIPFVGQSVLSDVRRGDACVALTRDPSQTGRGMPRPYERRVQNKYAGTPARMMTNPGQVVAVW
jgi:hypothetical protein